MCGRYGFIPSQDIAKRFELINSEDIDLHESYNIAPSTLNPVITKNSPKRIQLMRWGLVPGWWKQDPKRISFSTINARSEEIETKPVFRSAYKTKRCLVPASFFYEWAVISPKEKQPYYFGLKSRETFAFAGLFDIWKDAEGKQFPTYAIMTTSANKIVGKIHPRMPVILKKENEEEWADNSHFDPVVMRNLLQPYPEDKMASWPVTRAVGNPRNNSPQLIKPE